MKLINKGKLFILREDPQSKKLISVFIKEIKKLGYNSK